MQKNKHCTALQKGLHCRDRRRLRPRLSRRLSTFSMNERKVPFFCHNIHQCAAYREANFCWAWDCDTFRGTADFSLRCAQSMGECFSSSIPESRYPFFRLTDFPPFPPSPPFLTCTQPALLSSAVFAPLHFPSVCCLLFPVCVRVSLSPVSQKQHAISPFYRVSKNLQ